MSENTNRPITDKTNKMRLDFLKNVMKKKTFDFLKDPKKTLKFLDKRYENLNTKKSYLASIVSELKQHGGTLDIGEIPDDLISEYQKPMVATAKTVEEERGENRLTEREKKNWLLWEQIIKVRETLKKRAMDYNNYDNYLDYLILSLYTYNPPVRSDYGTMEFAKTLKQTKDQTTNYLYWSTKKKVFIFNYYKTSKKYGRVEIPVDDELIPIIAYWRSKYNSSKYLLASKQGKPMTDKYLSNRIRRIFKQETGKTTGINIMRHSFINNSVNEVNKLSVNDRKKIAGSMLHNVLQQLHYTKLF